MPHSRTFHLRLFPRRGLFEQGLAISIVGVNGSKRQHAIDPTQFYTGELLGGCGLDNSELELAMWLM